MARKIIYSKEEIEEMKRLYTEEGISTRELGKRFGGVAKSTIGRVLKEAGTELNHTNRKYNGDYRKFQKIDSPEKAYWLGFIAADGCNYQREANASVIINISAEDKSHLEKFKKFMNTNAEIIDHIQNSGFSNNTLMSKITLNSKDLSNDLADKGIVPKKSLILEPPKIEEKYYLPYILGYFDGDGSIFTTKQDIWGINFEGTKETLEWINKLLNVSEKLEKRYENKKNNYYIRCGGTNKPYLILKQLYDSCDTHLDRKYEKYKALETVVLNRNIK